MTLDFQDITFDAATGVIGEYELPVATTTTLGGVKIDGTTIGINDGVISKIANPWVSSYYQFLTGATTAADTNVLDFSNYLPNDSSTYDVMFRFYLNASSDSFNSCRIYDGSFITEENKLYVGSVAANVLKYVTSIITIPIGASRALTVEITGAMQNRQVQAFGYRKVI